jgi:hypothetical protein
MAIVFDNSATGSSSSTSVNFAHTLNTGSGNDRMVILGVSSRGNNSSDTLPTFVGYNGANATLAVTVTSGGFSIRSTLYYYLDANLPASPASYQITVSTSNAQQVAVGLISLTGVSQTAPEATASNTITSQVFNWSNTITSQTSNAWLIDCMSAELTGSGTADSGQVERWDINPSNLLALGSTKVTTSPTLYSMGWTFTAGSNRSAHTIMSLAPAAVAGGDDGVAGFFGCNF